MYPSNSFRHSGKKQRSFMAIALVIAASIFPLAKIPAQAPPNFISHDATQIYVDAAPAVGLCGSEFGIPFVSETGNLAYGLSFNGTYLSPIDSGLPSGGIVAVGLSNHGCIILFETPNGFMMTQSDGEDGFTTPQLISVPVPYLHEQPSLLPNVDGGGYLSLTIPTPQGNRAAIFTSLDGINYGNEIIPTNDTVAGGTSLMAFQVNGSGVPDLAIAYTVNGGSNSPYPVVAISADRQTFQTIGLTNFIINGDPILAIGATNNTTAEPALFVFGVDRYTNYIASAGTYDGVSYTSFTDHPDLGPVVPGSFGVAGGPFPMVIAVAQYDNQSPNPHQRIILSSTSAPVP